MLNRWLSKESADKDKIIKSLRRALEEKTEALKQKEAESLRLFRRTVSLSSEKESIRGDESERAKDFYMNIISNINEEFKAKLEIATEEFKVELDKANADFHSDYIPLINKLRGNNMNNTEKALIYKLISDLESLEKDGK
jgi:hypothetical protein